MTPPTLSPDPNASATDVNGGALRVAVLVLCAFAWACGDVDRSAAGSVEIEVATHVTLAITAADCPPGSNIILGTAGDDTLTGTGGNDCILGLGGNDTINGLGGEDTIDGGLGDDTIDGGNNADTIFGSEGNDTIIDGGASGDFIDGGPGDDFINGGNGGDNIVGGDGADTIIGGEGVDTIDGGAGADSIFGGTGSDVLVGGPGNDFIDGGTGSNTIDCGDGVDNAVGTNCEGVTPVRVAGLVEDERGVELDVVAVRGPSVLELWRVDDTRAVRFTGVARPVAEPGHVVLVDPAPRVGSRYAVVDRGPGGVEDVHGLDSSGAVALVRGALLRQQAPVRPPRAPAKPAPQTQGSIDGRFLPPAREEFVHLVEIPSDGVLLLPATIDERSVTAVWIEGVARPSFLCGTTQACVLVPPADPARGATLRRTGLVALGQGRPRSLVAGASSRASTGAPLLVTRRSVARPQLMIDWATPVEQMTHVGFIWNGWVPTLSVPAHARPGDGPVRAVAVDLVAWRADASAVHTVMLASTSMAPRPLSFVGERGAVAAALSAGEGASDVLTLTMNPLETAFDEALLVTGALVERVRDGGLVDGALVAHVAEGGHFAVEGPALVLVDDQDGGDARGALLQRGQVIKVGEGEVVAVLSATALAARAPAVTVRLPSPRRALGADLVAVVGAAPHRAEKARVALAPWLAARGGAVLRSDVVAHDAIVASMAGGLAGTAALRAFVATLAQARPAERTLFVVVIGDATVQPVADLDSAAGLFVPSPIVSGGRVLTMSDAQLASDDQGAWLPGVVVSRLPIPDIATLAPVAERLAAAAGLEGSLGQRAFAFTDPAADFGGSAALVSDRLTAGGIPATLLDGRIADATEVAAGLRDAGTAGDLLVYLGHGSSTKLANALSASAFDGAGGAAPPLSTLIGLTCMAGDVAVPYGRARLGEGLFTRPAGAVRTALLGGGFLDVTTHDRVGAALADALIEVDGGFGEVWLAARESALAAGASAVSIDAYALLGDPFARSGAP